MNRLAVMFLQNLQKYLKEHFWSKKKEKSNARKMLEQGSIILHFYSPSSDHSDILPDSDVDVDSDTDIKVVLQPSRVMTSVLLHTWDL